MKASFPLIISAWLPQAIHVRVVALIARSAASESPRSMETGLPACLQAEPASAAISADLLLTHKGLHSLFE
jgi:hypothetical protein